MRKNTKMRKIFIAVMAMVMVLGMSTSVFAATDAGTATVDIVIYDEDAGDATTVDTVTINAGQTLYQAVENEAALKIYEPDWEPGKDKFNGEETQYLTDFVGYLNRNIDHFYNPNPELFSWSQDLGWIFTVNGTMPTFQGEPNHYKAMNQYEVQSGDEIKLIYAETKTTWRDSDDYTVFEVLHPQI